MFEFATFIFIKCDFMRVDLSVSPNPYVKEQRRRIYVDIRTHITISVYPY